MIEARGEIERALAAAWGDWLAAAGEVRWSVFEDAIAQRARVRGFFATEVEAREAWAELVAALPAELAEPADLACLPVVEADWRESYKAHFKPWRCGRLHWVPEWERTRHRVPRGDVAVFLDPGLAFGTGNHETTRLCCERLVAVARQIPARRRAALRVIDAGCGSGILAISAEKLGFGGALAFDNDAVAASIARENVRRNGVASRVRVLAGDLASMLARRRADLVLANIQADVLVAHAGLLVAAVRPGGWLMLSGILARESAAVAAAFEKAAGARCESGLARRRAGEWSCLTLRLARG